MEALVTECGSTNDLQYINLRPHRKVEAKVTKNSKDQSVDATHAALALRSCPIAMELLMTQPHGLSLRRRGVRGAGQMQTLRSEAIQAGGVLTRMDFGHELPLAAACILLIVPDDLTGKTGQ